MSKIKIKGLPFPAVRQNVEIRTYKNGMAKRVFVDGKEIMGAMSVNIRYGVAVLPIVTVGFMADNVTITEDEQEREKENGHSGIRTETAGNPDTD